MGQLNPPPPQLPRTPPMTLSSYHLPAQADWQAFERFTRDLFSARWVDNRAWANGRTGQPQAGVYVFGTNARTSQLEGVRCKCRDACHLIKSRHLRGELRYFSSDELASQNITLSTSRNVSRFHV